jgi:hypothetical protein
MDIHLVVARPFAGYARGDAITDAAKINEILAGEFATHVVRVSGATPRREG